MFVVSVDGSSIADSGVVPDTCIILLLGF